MWRENCMTIFKIFKRDFPKVLKNAHSCLLLSGTQLNQHLHLLRTMLLVLQANYNYKYKTYSLVNVAVKLSSSFPFRPLFNCPCPSIWHDISFSSNAINCHLVLFSVLQTNHNIGELSKGSYHSSTDTSPTRLPASSVFSPSVLPLTSFSFPLSFLLPILPQPHPISKSAMALDSAVSSSSRSGQSPAPNSFLL